MTNARGIEMTCQEQVALGNLNTDCNAPAEFIVDNGDSRPYWMCPGCADHNKRNRGAVVYVVKSRSALDEVR